MNGDPAVVFSSAPYGALWICTRCDKVHVRLGDCMVMISTEALSRLSEFRAVDEAVCGDCGGYRLACDHGHLDIPLELLPRFFVAAANMLEALKCGWVRSAARIRPTAWSH